MPVQGRPTNLRSVPELIRGPPDPTVPRDGRSVLTRLHLITTRAEGDPTATFNNLYTLLNYDLLWHGVAPKCRTLVVLNFSGYTKAQRSVQWPRRQPAGSVVRVDNIAMR